MAVTSPVRAGQREHPPRKRPEEARELFRRSQRPCGLERLVPERAGHPPDDPRISEGDRANAHAHLRATLLGQSIAVGIRQGELALGRLQSIVFAELDGPRKRKLSIQVIGE